MAVFYNTSQLDKQIEGEDDHLVIFKPTTETITYYFLGAWEHEKEGLKSEQYFVSHLDQLLQNLNSTNTLK